MTVQPTAQQTYAFPFQVSDTPLSPGDYLVFAPAVGGKSDLTMQAMRPFLAREGQK